MGKLTQSFWTKVAPRTCTGQESPADYAVAAKALLTEDIIEAWDTGFPLEYLTAVTA